MTACNRLIQIEDFIVDSRILLEYFVCDLDACHGVCCYEGTSGAPLNNEEIEILTDELPRLKPLLTPEGKKALRKGVAYRDFDGEWVTTLVDDRQCALSIVKNGTYLCAVEIAHAQGKTTAQKPISCHLYPIRVGRSGVFTLLRFDIWNICYDALANGKSLGVRVYQFLREPIIRAFGESFYNALDRAAALLDENPDAPCCITKT